MSENKQSNTNENKSLQRLYYTSCKGYLNYFNDCYSGGNVLAASEKGLSLDECNKILCLSSSSIAFCEDCVFTFVAPTENARGAICATFPTRDDVGRASEFRNVIYDLKRDDLELRQCAAAFWCDEIQGYKERAHVWPDDYKEAVPKSKEPVVLEAFRKELDVKANDKTKEILELLNEKNDKAERWRKMFWFLLEAYLLRKHDDSRIFLVAPAEDVALAILGLASLLPKQILSGTSFAIRESNLTRPLTIIGLDRENQKRQIDGAIKHIIYGSSTDLLYDMQAPEGEEIVGENNLDSGKERAVLTFLKDIDSGGKNAYFEKTNPIKELLDEIRFDCSDLSLSQRLDVLDCAYCISKETKDQGEIKKSLEKIGANEYLAPLKKYLVDNLDTFLTFISQSSEPQFTLLWRCVPPEKRQTFIEQISKIFLEKDKEYNETCAVDLVREKDFLDYISDKNNLNFVGKLVNRWFSIFVEKNELSTKIKESKDLRQSLLKVFEGIIPEKTLETKKFLETICVWFDDQYDFLEFVVGKCSEIKWDEESTVFVKEEIRKYFFEVNEDTAKYQTWVLCEEKILLPFDDQSQTELVKTDFLGYMQGLLQGLPSENKKLEDFLKEVLKNKDRAKEYKKLHEKFSAIIDDFNKISDNLGSNNCQNAKHYKTEVQKSLKTFEVEVAEYPSNAFTRNISTSIKNCERNPKNNKTEGWLIDDLQRAVIEINVNMDYEKRNFLSYYDSRMKVKRRDVVKEYGSKIKPLNSDTKSSEDSNSKNQGDENNVGKLCDLLFRNKDIWGYLGKEGNGSEQLIDCDSIIFYQDVPEFLKAPLISPKEFQFEELGINELKVKQQGNVDNRIKKRTSETILTLGIVSGLGIPALIFLILLFSILTKPVDPKGNNMPPGEAGAVVKEAADKAGEQKPSSETDVATLETTDEITVAYENTSNVNDDSVLPLANSLPLYFEDSNGKAYCKISPGSFKMGSPLTDEDIRKKYPTSDDLKDIGNAPQHEEKIKQVFYLARSPVTRGDFEKFVQDAEYKTTAENTENIGQEGSWRKPRIEQKDDEEPVVCISYEDAIAYVNWLNMNSRSYDKLKGYKPKYRLPGEVEWEYACRAGRDTEFSWGDDEKDGKDYLNARDIEYQKQGKGEPKNSSFSFNDGYKGTSPVEKFRTNQWGLCDMLGNVWEWTSSCHDPQDSSSDAEKILRGGAFDSSPAACRCASRRKEKPRKVKANVGFRVAFSLVPPDDSGANP